MRNILRLFFMVFLINSQSSCTSIAKTDDAPFDSSVAGIELLDSKSYINSLGNNTKFYNSENSVYTQHYNGKGDEMLTIFSSPAKKFHATLFSISKLNKKFLLKRHVMQNVITFKTGRGIHLGMTSTEVLHKLGDQYDKANKSDGVVVYRYMIRNTEGEEYKSEYHFFNNKLVELVFGY